MNPNSQERTTAHFLPIPNILVTSQSRSFEESSLTLTCRGEYPVIPHQPAYPQQTESYSVPSFSLACEFTEIRMMSFVLMRFQEGAHKFIELRLRTKALNTTSSTKNYLKFIFKHASHMFKFLLVTVINNFKLLSDLLPHFHSLVKY